MSNQICPIGFFPVVEDGAQGKIISCVEDPSSVLVYGSSVQKMFPEDCDKYGNCYSPEFYSGTLYCEDSTGKCLPPSKANCPKGVIEDDVTATTEGLCRKIYEEPWWTGATLDSEFTKKAIKDFAKENGLSESEVRSAIEKGIGGPTQSQMKILGKSYTAQQQSDIALSLRLVRGSISRNPKRDFTRLIHNLSKYIEDGSLPASWIPGLKTQIEILRLFDTKSSTASKSTIRRDPMTPVIF